MSEGAVPAPEFSVTNRLPAGSTIPEAPAPEQRQGKLLKDDDGYYVLDAHAIHELLDVNKYIEASTDDESPEYYARTDLPAPISSSIGRPNDCAKSISPAALSA